MDLQGRCGASLGPEWNPGLPGELRREALDCGVQRAVAASSDGNRERLIDSQLPAARLNGGRHRHQVELRLGLGLNKKCAGKDGEHDQQVSHDVKEFNTSEGWPQWSSASASRAQYLLLPLSYILVLNDVSPLGCCQSKIDGLDEKSIVNHQHLGVF